MNYKIYDSNTFLFPDYPVETNKLSEIHMSPCGHSAIQILIEGEQVGKSFELSATVPEGLSLTMFKGKSVIVDENTAPTLMTTKDYSLCKDYVIRQAPFRVYDALIEIENKTIQEEENLLLYILINCAGNTKPSKETLRIHVSGETIEIPLSIHTVAVPKYTESQFERLDFVNYENISKDHNVAHGTDEWFEMYATYVKSLIGYRVSHIMLPLATPIKNAKNDIIDFDFSIVERCAKTAFSCGAKYICAPHIAHWKEWDDITYYLVWDMDIDTEGVQGFIQLKKYFTGLAKIIKNNGWENKTYQSLADEPQTKNDTAYRALAAIARQILPSVPIIEAVETTKVGGAVDIWVPKQVYFEQRKEEFNQLIENGEKFWFYTCAFPAGNTMNRSMDLPLLQCREVFWQGFLYNFTGFLHWGFNFYIGENVFTKACCPHKGELLPAGDAHIVYPYKKKVLPSVRYFSQMMGCEDVELLMLLDKKTADEIASTVTTSFNAYNIKGNVFEEARTRLLKALDEEKC